jgi:hypothetical protein
MDSKLKSEIQKHKKDFIRQMFVRSSNKTLPKQFSQEIAKKANVHWDNSLHDKILSMAKSYINESKNIVKESFQEILNEKKIKYEATSGYDREEKYFYPVVNDVNPKNKWDFDLRWSDKSKKFKTEREAIAAAKKYIEKELKESFQEIINERCWDGYKPTPGKKPYEKGSCQKEEDLDEKYSSTGDSELDMLIKKAESKKYAVHVYPARKMVSISGSKAVDYKTAKIKLKQMVF